MDELNALSYLDAVIREVLRLYPPVVATTREACRDDVIPLNTPYTDRHGLVHDHIRCVPISGSQSVGTHPCDRIQKGTTILVPILTLNRSKALWGEDAAEFKYDCSP